MLTNALASIKEANLSKGEKSAQLNYCTNVASFMIFHAKYLKDKIYIAVKNLMAMGVTL